MTAHHSSSDVVKRAIRSQVLAARRAAHLAVGATAGRRIAEAFLAAVPHRADQVVAAYWPIGDEADPRPLLEDLAAFGCATALPVVVERAAPLIFRRWRDGSPLERGLHGTWHPPAGAPQLIPDLLLVPVVAFDRHGRRLGYGGGYYDRTVAALRAVRPLLTVGIAYAAQEVPAVPCDGHDQRLDWIVTEDAAREALP